MVSEGKPAFLTLLSLGLGGIRMLSQSSMWILYIGSLFWYEIKARHSSAIALLTYTVAVFRHDLYRYHVELHKYVGYVQLKNFLTSAP